MENHLITSALLTKEEPTIENTFDKNQLLRSYDFTVREQFIICQIKHLYAENVADHTKKRFIAKFFSSKSKPNKSLIRIFMVSDFEKKKLTLKSIVDKYCR